MRLAYVDPPYLGAAAKHYAKLHPDAARYDTLEAHAELIESLSQYHGWALSMSSRNLRDLLPLCPSDVRVMAWVKPFTTFWPNVNPAYAWEPIIIRQARVPDRPTIRDWYAEVSPAQKGGYTGQKPENVCWWVFESMGADPADELVDLFPGSGAVGRAWSEWSAQLRLIA